ncbi:MAG: PDZ domain-containing protein [Pirellulales bacterium]|nr:PDZ domain-containing protein [Pirellulales bacterium]
MYAFRVLSLILSLLCSGAVAARAAEDADVATLEQQALNAAVDAVADSVVQIRTIGGLDRIGQQELAQGPTTGLIVSADGYIVSSAFNFAQEPTSVLVRLPGGEQRPAETVGRDTNRMLVLLKVDAEEPLPVPPAAAMDGVRPGDWAVAVGRTHSAERVSVSVGVVSALDRMHGRALQTDASVSPTNYGGPLMDVHGRVLGVLAPMALQSGAAETSAVAGAELYDSGIGFAVPLTHILDVLDRWKEEKELKRGLLGVSLTPGNAHATPPTITAVWPRSPAAEAGWKPKDRIVAIEGKPVDSQTDLRFQVTPRYAGDTFEVTIRRGKGDAAKELKTEVTLSDELPAYRHAFLGVLPERGALEVAPAREDDEPADEDEKSDEKQAKDDEPAAGVTIRAAWPDSPADRAGLRVGDRITQLGEEKVRSIGEAIAQLNAKSAGDNLTVYATRDDEELKLDVELAELPVDVLSSSDLPDREEDDDAKRGEAAKLEELKLPEMSQTARYYRPSGDGAPLGLLVWLGDGKKESAEAMLDAWKGVCRRDRLVLLMPEPGDKAGWSTDDMEYLAKLLQTAVGRFRVDSQRVVLAGDGKAGQLAYALAFQGRKLIRGVAVIDSPLPRTLELPDNNPNERLAILSVETQNTPLSLLIRQDRQKLADAGYPATQLVRRGEANRQAMLDATTRGKIARWIDGLDRF